MGRKKERGGENGGNGETGETERKWEEKGRFPMVKTENVFFQTWMEGEIFSKPDMSNYMDRYI